MKSIGLHFSFIVCTYMYTCACHNTHVEVKGQLTGVSLCLLIRLFYHASIILSRLTSSMNITDKFIHILGIHTEECFINAVGHKKYLRPNKYRLIMLHLASNSKVWRGKGKPEIIAVSLVREMLLFQRSECTGTMQMLWRCQLTGQQESMEVILLLKCIKAVLGSWLTLSAVH